MKRKVDRRYREALESRPVRGQTELWFQGCSGQGLLLYKGGPAQVADFRQIFCEILEDNVTEWLSHAQPSG